MCCKYGECEQVIWRDKLCVFHHQDVEAKKEDFRAALIQYIKRCGESVEKVYNFRGFVFPPISFIGKIFEKPVDFRDSRFSGDVYFRASQFTGDAYFSASRFSGAANFRESQFSGAADFRDSQFSKDAYFRAGQFSGDADFRDSQFSGDVYFRDSQFSGAYFGESRFGGDANFRATQFSGDADFGASQFSGDANFRESQFRGSADFRESRFRGSADFRESQFKGDADYWNSRFEQATFFSNTSFFDRANFSHAVFSDELDLQGASFAFLKNMTAPRGNFRRTLLQEAHLFGQEEIAACDFQGAVLVAVSFAGKRIRGCDFTGTVFKAVHVDGWEVDQATIEDTKYIYTDMRAAAPASPKAIPAREGLSEQKRKAWNEKQTALPSHRPKYFPLESSRVPAVGEFGDSDNPDFFFTDFLREPHKWHYAIGLPRDLQNQFISYSLFFKEYLVNTRGIDVGIETRKEGRRMRITVTVADIKLESPVQEAFQDYIRHVTNPFEDINVSFQDGIVSKRGQSRFLIQFQHLLMTTWTVFADDYKNLPVAEKLLVRRALSAICASRYGDRLTAQINVDEGMKQYEEEHWKLKEVMRQVLMKLADQAGAV